MSIASDTKANLQAAERMRAVAAWEDDRLLACVPTVSRWSSAQQLDHITAACAMMLDAIDDLRAGAKRADIQARGRPRAPGYLVLRLGRIPRGRAPAPAGLEASEALDLGSLRTRVEVIASRLGATATDAPALKSVPGVFRHPSLGWFHAPRWWRFAWIHSDHHLRIIADIDAAWADAARGAPSA